MQLICYHHPPLLTIAAAANNYNNTTTTTTKVHDVWGFQWSANSNCILYTRQDSKFRPSELWLHEIEARDASGIINSTAGGDSGSSEADERENRVAVAEKESIGGGSGGGGGGEDRLLHRETDDRFFLDVGKTKDGVFLTINSHSKVSTQTYQYLCTPNRLKHVKDHTHRTHNTGLPVHLHVTFFANQGDI
jgi:protease II